MHSLPAQLNPRAVSMRMEVKRGRNDEEDLLGMNGESQSRLKLLRRSSTSKIRLSDRTVKLLEEKVSFPNVSKCRLKHIKASIFTPGFCFRDAYECPDPRAVSKEYRIGSYFDTQCQVYSETFVDMPKAEVGKQLDVLELLGDGDLLRFSTSSQNVPSIRPTKSSEGLCKGFKKTNTGGSGDGRCDVERIQRPVLRRCANVVGGGGAMACTTSTTTTGKTEFVSMERTLNLKGKHVMICCVFVPSIWCSEDGLLVYHTALASHELARRDDFELVVVPMMREGFTHSLSAYQHFLSGFSCLAVPFQDSHRREFICSSLGFDGKLDCLVLDPSQEVLYHGPPLSFPFVGAAHECFPFTPDREWLFLSSKYNRENRSLGELLGLSDTDVLYNIEYLAGGRLKEEDGHSITISELKQKVVGVYIHWDGLGLRLDSLLTWEAVHAALDPECKMDIPVEKLKGKIVVLYLYQDSQKCLADKLAAWYKRYIKGWHSNVEVVAVCIDVDMRFGAMDEEFMDMGWLVCCADPTKAARLCKEYFHPRLKPREALVAFDEDGRIASLDPNHIFQCKDPPFHGDLREEICLKDFEDAGYDYMPH
ncbi:unnamed protein product [Cuscuta campestris]|uniref:Thioredoxin-like fold domain-containing protein n=1 Tax=Cuscuta campestris TaxID=132261 RepID=A0A484KZU8_9ASTE|nr:unnamed protein product [Cuscuta campestris]